MQKLKERYSAVALSATILLTTLFSSCQSDEIKISGRFIGGDGEMAYLEEINSLSGIIVDSVKLSKDGEFAFNLKAKDHQHKLYNIVYDWSTIPLFAAAGDKIKLNSVGNIAKNYTVEGSAESELMRTFYQNYIAGITSLDRIATRYADESISDEARQSLALEYNTEYTRIKREQVGFIITNKSSLAAVYALYQRLPNDNYLFNGQSDAIYYRTVVEALEESYPDSPYRKSLQADIDEFDAYNSLVINMEERGYPDLRINDMFGQEQRLSDLEGKVILIDFWSAQVGSSNRNNADLKEIYEEYHDRGFEVYQVGIDTSKSTWINTIQDQGLPWISVSELKGNQSTALTLFNVKSLPTNFLVSKDGDIVARDIYGDNLKSLLKAEIAK